MTKAILTLYKSTPDHKGVERRVLAGDVEFAENGNVVIQTIVGEMSIKQSDFQISVILPEGVELPDPLPEHVWRLN